MRKLKLKSVGQVQEVDISFGDLTILTGPQATGKSIFLQFLKLVQDHATVSRDIRKYGFDWQADWREFLGLYLGGGLANGWKGESSIEVDGKPFDLAKRVTGVGRRPMDEKVFLIPAQRVTVFRNGWPRSFLDFDRDEPYAVGAFSEALRLYMEGRNLAEGKALAKGWKQALSRSWDDSVFHKAELILAREGAQRKLVLDLGEGQKVPYSSWSAGQREFAPLLLGLAIVRFYSNKYETVVVEEPETGLHPQAIVSTMVLLFDLLARGKRVVLSTHSPAVLDVVWAFQELRRNLKDPKAFARACQELFGVGSGAFEWEDLRRKSFRTHHLHLKAETGLTISQDISSLDPGEEDERISGWGGLTGFSGKAADLVARSLNGSI